MPTSSSIRVAPMSDTFTRIVTAAAASLATCYAAEQAANARALGFARLAYEIRDDEGAHAAALAAMNAADAAWEELRSVTDAAWARLVALVGDDDAPAWVLPDAEPAASFLTPDWALGERWSGYQFLTALCEEYLTGRTPDWSF